MHVPRKTVPILVFRGLNHAIVSSPIIHGLQNRFREPFQLYSDRRVDGEPKTLWLIKLRPWSEGVRAFLKEAAARILLLLLIIIIIIFIMHSNYAANSRCEEEHFTVGPSFVVGRNVLPTIEEESDLDGTQYLEDIELLLEGSTDMAVPLVLDEVHHGHRSRHDLTLLMSERDKVDLLQHQCPTIGLRQRLEIHLEEALSRANQERFTNDEHNDEETARASNDGHKSSSDHTCKGKETVPPIVWVIQPGFDTSGGLRFKFSTDSGAYLLLKEEEARESVVIMATSSRNTFFQVYSLQGAVSRIVKRNEISKVIEEIVVEAKPMLEDDGDQILEVGSKTKKGPGQRLFRYMVRRRWKNVVRRQVGIAMGNDMKRARGWLVFFPILLVWKFLTRRSRTF